jgi:hypothetical protein
MSDLYIKYNRRTTYPNEVKVSKSKLCLTGSERCRNLNRKVLIWVVRARPKLGIERACIQDSTHLLTNGETVPSWTRLDSNYNRYLITATEIVLWMHGIIEHGILKNVCLRAYREAYLHSKVCTCSDIGSRRRQVNKGALSIDGRYHESGGNKRFDWGVHCSCEYAVIEELVNTSEVSRFIYTEGVPHLVVPKLRMKHL